MPFEECSVRASRNAVLDVWAILEWARATQVSDVWGVRVVTKGKARVDPPTSM